MKTKRFQKDNLKFLNGAIKNRLVEDPESSGLSIVLSKSRVTGSLSV